MRYVIIGNSAAAIGCVEGIRAVDPAGSILLVSQEPYHTYSRPLISYLLQGKTDRERMKYRPDSFYADHGVECRLGTAVTAVDPAAKEIVLEGGQRLPYDRLLCATGSQPFVPPMEGLDSVDKKFTFLSLDDALALERALTPDSRVLIVGGGLIGLKCAEGIAGRCASITVVDLADRILMSILDAEAAALMQAHLEAHGLVFHLGDSVSSFQEHRAQLQSGGTVDFDVLVLAVGVRPRTQLLAAAGAQIDRGIVTDANGLTSLPDIYAAGDCTASWDISSESRRVLALLPNAYMQGEAAGRAMAGEPKPFNKAIPMNAIGFFGYHIITAGSYTGQAHVHSHGQDYKALFTQDDRLKGYILMGDVARAGIYTALIREQTPLSTVDFDLIMEKPQLMAFSRTDRIQKLGGAPC